MAANDNSSELDLAAGDAMTDTRPMLEDVELALLVSRPGAEIGPNVACVLAAEVRYLRQLVSDQATHLRAIRDSHHELEAEFAECRRNHEWHSLELHGVAEGYELRLREAQATVARVEALCSDDSAWPNRSGYELQDLLREALRVA
jgi:hypothetical protein